MNLGDERLSATAERLGAVAGWARSASRTMSPLQRMEGLQVVRDRLRQRQAARPRRVGISLVAMAAGLAAVVLVGRGQWQAERAESRAIGFEIRGGAIGDGGYIRSFDSTGTVLHFAEGTELHLKAGARGRLGTIDSRGARLAIEQGEAEVKVTPRPGARWLVDAGPFLIRVRGTVFTASWDGVSEQLDVTMSKGLVSVTGPLAEGALSVSAGQRLTVDLRRHEVLLKEVDGAAVRAGAASGGVGGEFGGEVGQVGQTRPAAAVFREPALRAVPAHAGSTNGARGWSAALAAGDLDLILREAERLGLRRSLSESSRQDLAALADAARYRRRDEIAYQALSAERDRFSGSLRARDAAFLLGRLEEGRGHDGSSLQWYDLYLREAPSGAYSSEALGRKMMAVKRLRGSGAARAIAEVYLKRFPSGTYAGAARALREAP